jgi:hypothetical protein
LDGIASGIHNVDFKTWVRRTKPGGLPVFDSDVIVRRAMIRIRRHPTSIPSDIGPAQVENSHCESFDAPNSSFNIRDG